MLVKNDKEADVRIAQCILEQHGEFQSNFNSKSQDGTQEFTTSEQIERVSGRNITEIQNKMLLFYN